MLKKSTNYINLISILILIYLAFMPLKPHKVDINTIIEGRFSIENSIEHLSHITNHPHYTGSQNQKWIKSYLMRELKSLGLDVRIQKTNVANNNNTFTEVENIFTTIKGSDTSADAKSLLVMSHYDSAPYSSLGASDAGSGIVVILEGIRAYLAQKIQPKNDIIILFTDAEEIGLLGAKAFVNRHRLYQNIGAVLNFEARGTAGSSYMFMETNTGNHGMLEVFKKANVQLGQSNSLAYSIYKMLPNDTDLTVFREDIDAVGFNFAFIDNHFNYHTQLDNARNLSLDSLAHQALYLMPMLDTLSQIDLSTLRSETDDVYFQVPFWKTISYPFDWAISLSLINLLIFLLVIAHGVKIKKLKMKSMLTGSMPLFKSLIASALLGFTLLKFLYWLHPHYSEILQGFTYNGHIYVVLFALMSVSICYFFYRSASEKHSPPELMAVPILIWIIFGFVFALKLTGAHFFILISLLGTIALAVNVYSTKPQATVTLMLFAPVLLIFTPFLKIFPVALGLMILPFSGLLITLILSVFISCIIIPKQYYINKWIFILPLICIYIFAETQASFNPSRPKPNSLYYFQDHDTQSAFWFSRDNEIDNWTKTFFEKGRLDAPALNEFKKQHGYAGYGANIVAKTENKNIATAQVEVIYEREYTDKHIYKLEITPQRPIHKMVLIHNTPVNLLKLAINKEILHEGKPKSIKANRRMASIYRQNELSFVIDIELSPGENLDFTLIEMSPNILESRHFDIQPRPDELIPKPFINSDSIITKQKYTY